MEDEHPEEEVVVLLCFVLSCILFRHKTGKDL